MCDVPEVLHETRMFISEWHPVEEECNRCWASTLTANTLVALCVLHIVRSRSNLGIRVRSYISCPSLTSLCCHCLVGSYLEAGDCDSRYCVAHSTIDKALCCMYMRVYIYIQFIYSVYMYMGVHSSFPCIRICDHVILRRLPCSIILTLHYHRTTNMRRM